MNDVMLVLGISVGVATLTKRKISESLNRHHVSSEKT